MLPSSRRYRPVAWLLALVIPVIVFAGAWQWFQRPAEVTGKAAAMERTLQRGRRPDVVVLGSSLARTNVRLEVLADELGVHRKKVTLLALPNATAAHWYAIMKNRVFGNGYEPKIVLIVGALTTMVTPDVLMDSNVERLVNQLSGDEPVIGAKVFGAKSARDFQYLYLREQAGQVRDGLLEDYRDLALSLTFRGKGNAQAGGRLAERANEVVFADEKMDYELFQRASTGLYVGAVEQIDLEGIDIENDSLLGDISRLAVEHGARVVFVRTPFPPSNSANDYVPPAYEEEAIRVIEAAGGVYIDMRGIGLNDNHFRDMRHMSREGGAIFTRELARTLRELHALSGRGPQASSLSLTPASVTRSEPGPGLTRVQGHAKRLSSCAWRIEQEALAPISERMLRRAGHPTASPLRVTQDGTTLPWRAVDPDRCEPGVSFGEDGLVVVTEPGVGPESLALALERTPSFQAPGEPYASWWVYPGTTLTFTFDTPWTMPPEAFDAFLLGHVLGGDAKDVSLTVGGVDVPTDGEGLRVWASGKPAVPDSAPWTVEVHVPEGGPWLLIQNLSLGRAPFSTDLVGLPEMLAGASIRVVGGKVEDTQVSPAFLNDPPTLTYGGKVRQATKDVPYFAVPRYLKLADAPGSRSANPHKCSPLRVLEDGVQLPEPHVTCFDMANLKQGRSCHAGNVLYFTGSDSSDPDTNGRTYDLVLDPSRICDKRNQRDITPIRGAVWLYPGDHLVLDLPQDKLDTFYDGANRFEYALDPILHEAGDEVEVRLYVDDELILTDVITSGDKRREYRRRSIEPALDPRQGKVRIEVVNRDEDAFWLLVMAAISEDYVYGDQVARADAEEAFTESVDDTDVAAEEALVPEVFEDPSVASGSEPAGAWAPSVLERFGAVPELPALKDVKVRKDGNLEGALYALWPVSNTVLVERGYGWWSPVRLVDADGPMPPAVRRSAFGETDCERCTLHLDKTLQARAPAGGAEAVSARLQADVPNLTAEGEPVLWVYPGSGVRMGFDRPWAGEQVVVRVRADLLTTTKNTSWAPPRLRLGTKEVAFEPAEKGWEASLTVDGTSEDRWWFDVRSAGGAPYVLLLAVEVQDEAGTWSVYQAPARRTPARGDE